MSKPRGVLASSQGQGPQSRSGAAAAHDSRSAAGIGVTALAPSQGPSLVASVYYAHGVAVEKLSQETRKLCEASHVVALQGVQETDMRQVCTRLPDSYVNRPGDREKGLHIIWDSRRLRNVSFILRRVFPDTDEGRYRGWRKYLEARVGQSLTGRWARALGATRPGTARGATTGQG